MNTAAANQELATRIVDRIIPGADQPVWVRAAVSFGAVLAQQATDAGSASMQRSNAKCSTAEAPNHGGNSTLAATSGDDDESGVAENPSTSWKTDERDLVGDDGGKQASGKPEVSPGRVDVTEPFDQPKHDGSSGISKAIAGCSTATAKSNGPVAKPRLTGEAVNLESRPEPETKKCGRIAPHATGFNSGTHSGTAIAPVGEPARDASGRTEVGSVATADQPAMADPAAQTCSRALNDAATAQPAQKVQGWRLNSQDPPGTQSDAAEVVSADVRDKPKPRRVESVLGGETDGIRASQPAAKDHTAGVAANAGVATSGGSMAHSGDLRIGQTALDASTAMLAPSAGFGISGTPATSLPAGISNGTPHAGHSVGPSPFAQMDSAKAPQVLESAPQRLTVGVRDSGLGWMEIRAHAEGGHVAAILATTSSDARAALSAHLPEVREYLADQQVRVDRLSSETFSPAGGDRQNPRGESQRQTPLGDQEKQAQVSDESPFSAPSAGEALTYINVRA